MTTIYRYIQLGIHVRARYDKITGKFMREVCEVCEFFVNEQNKPESNTIYLKNVDGTEVINGPSKYLIDYLERQGVDLTKKEFTNISHGTPNNVSSQNVNTNQVPTTGVSQTGTTTNPINQTPVMPNINTNQFVNSNIKNAYNDEELL